MKKIFIAFLFLITSSQAFSQASELGSWYSYLGTYDVHKRWNLQANTQFRFHNIMGDWDQILLRAGANYKLDKKGKYQAGLGFDYFYNEPYIGDSDVKTNFNEYRIYEQLVMRSNVQRFYFQHRYRLENIFLEDQDVKFRFRYMLQVRMALNKKRIQPGTFYAALLNETWINFKGPNHFDRHWLQYTLGYQLNKKWTFEVGNQTQFSGIGAYNSRLQFWAFHNLNLLKKRRHYERPPSPRMTP
jgi:hypothetical protein